MNRLILSLSAVLQLLLVPAWAQNLADYQPPPIYNQNPNPYVPPQSVPQGQPNPWQSVGGPSSSSASGGNYGQAPGINPSAASSQPGYQQPGPGTGPSTGFGTGPGTGSVSPGRPGIPAPSQPSYQQPPPGTAGIGTFVAVPQGGSRVPTPVPGQVPGQPEIYGAKPGSVGGPGTAFSGSPGSGSPGQLGGPAIGATGGAFEDVEYVCAIPPPYRSECPDGRKSQFVLRWSVRDGRCCTYPFGHCKGEDIAQSAGLLRTKEACEELCLGSG